MIRFLFRRFPNLLVGAVKKPFPYRFALAELTKLPILGSFVDYSLFHDDDILYLPHDRIIEIHEAVDPSQDMLLPSQVVEHFVEEANYHWIMDSCLCREADRCEHYPVDLGCLFLGQATLGINPKLGRHVTKGEALEHLRRCREAGLVHMVGRNKLDTLWLGVGPGNKLLTICNCCPCCCLWRVIPNVAPEISAKVNRMPGVSVTVGDGCVACGTCTEGVCFVDAIHLSNRHAVITEDCRGCGRCVIVCPEQVIELTIDDEQFVKRSIDRLSARVDVA
jgi:NAD-dependent dihydropyrimidine dehydrogenase PreA subunit